MHGVGESCRNREPEQPTQRLKHGMSGVVLRSDRHNANVGMGTTACVGETQRGAATALATRERADVRGDELLQLPGRGTTTVTMTAEGAARPAQEQVQEQEHCETRSHDSRPHHTAVVPGAATSTSADARRAAAPAGAAGDGPETTTAMGEGEDVTSMIAREGSELAQRLRDSGWVARAGWRSSDASGRAVWHLRFEQPASFTPETV